MRAKCCAWPNCRAAETELTYLGQPLCRRHWVRFCHMQEERGHEQAYSELDEAQRHVRTLAGAR